ncbi:MAG: hypothetical protein JWO52_6759 [Gammaproteobacteria bacterium]|nr:hypothetical protein [Gammaproteobacteria bacterium]
MVPTQRQCSKSRHRSRCQWRQNPREQNDRDKGSEEYGPKKNPTFRPSDLHGNQLGADKRFESAFIIAESDGDLADYAQSGNYYLRKLLLWECHLEAANQGVTHEHLRAALNMAVDENSIRETYARERLPGSLRGRDYFNLRQQ